MKEQVELEKTRARTTIQELQSRWHTEQKQWREAVDTLQACHRIAHLRVQAEVESGRKNVLIEQAARRKEKLAVAQRDFMITKFQIRESELERAIEEEEGKASEAKMRYEQEIRLLKGKVAELVAHVHAQEELIEAGDLAQGELQDQLTELQKARAEKEVSSESVVTKLERTAQQLRNEQGKNTDLEGSIDDLKKTNEDLKRQVDKFKTLENKGGAEMESLRKKKVELEVHVQALESKLAKREGDNTKSSEKAKAKVKKLEENRVMWQERAEDLEEELRKLKADFTRANDEIAKLRSKLKLNGTTSKTSPTVSPRKNANAPVVDDSEDDVEEVQDAVVPASLPPPVPADSGLGTSSSKKPTRRGRAQSKIVNDDDVQEVPPPAIVKGKARDTTLDSEDNCPKTKGTRARNKPPDRKGSRRSPVVAESDSEIEEIPSTIPGNEKVNHKEKGGRKRKHTSDEDDAETVGDRKATQRKKDEDQTALGNKRRSKSKPPQSRAGNDSLGPAVVPDESASNLANAKPKKRKINLYPSGNKEVPSFNFRGTDIGGLNIPTELSPVREEDAPASTLSRPFNLLRLGFSSKR
ncbi:hypothetical protein L218DRAFT_954955 [Marasmius fiardii PR-910]|nr:hypothetical protein L218DRAFT_954955 [Marasmius fiardii PR-910]